MRWAELEEDGGGSRECWWGEQSYRSLFFALLSPSLTTTHTRHPRKQRGRRVPKTRKTRTQRNGGSPSDRFKNQVAGDLQDGGGVRGGDHLPPHKYIKNTSACGTTPTEHLLNAGRRPQTSQKSGRGTDALRQPTCRDGSKSKAEPQELYEQRREKEISPSSLRSSILNLHNQLDVPCTCGIPEQTMNHPKIEVVDFGSNCRLGVSFLHLICFWFYVYFSLVFRAYYLW